MNTLVFQQNTGSAADIIKKGGLVAVPTETVYGLAGDALNEETVKKIYEVKGRPPVKPLSIMISGKVEMLKYASEIPAAAEILADEFWPGPLTIVLKAKETVPEIVRAGGKTIGLRCPAHSLTLRLIEQTGTALAAPSANISGGKSPVCAEDVIAVFNGMIDAVIDGGVCSFQKESTLIDLSSRPYRILRNGAVSEEKIRDVLTENMRVIGITGPSGAGKTSVLEIYRDEGAFVIDCDHLYHELLNSDTEMAAEILKRFPAADSGSGSVDRKKLGNIVFHDENELLALNRISHRYIQEKVWQMLRENAMAGYQLAVIDAVELISGGLDQLCDFTIAVLANREKRIERIMLRDGIDRSHAELRVDAQKNDAYYKEHCSIVLYNNEDVDITSDAFKNKILKLTRE